MNSIDNTSAVGVPVVVAEAPAGENCAICWGRHDVRPICCGRIQLRPNSTVLRCGHVYCAACINEWVRTSREATCPECRARVHTYEGPHGEVLAEGRSVRFRKYAKILAGGLLAVGTLMATVLTNRGIGG